VAANVGAARSGTVTVATATVTISQEAPAEIELQGRIDNLSGQCPNLTFTLEGRTVRTDGNTVFEDRCDRLRDRRQVTVWALPEPGGTLRATRLRRGD